jgi:hypothetical protein
MDRVAAVRKALTEDLRLADLAARGFEVHGGGGIGLGVLRRSFFPDLVVTVTEAFEADDDRVVATLELSARGMTWGAIAILRFAGDEVVEVRSVADDLPWMQLLGVVPDDAALERALDAAAGTAAKPGT